MSASSVPIPLDQFALALTSLEVPQIHEESARLENSLYHLERSNTTLAEYPEDEDCRDAIRHNLEVIEQQKLRVELIRLELQRRGVNVGHMGLITPSSGDRTGPEVHQQAGEGTSASGTNNNASANGSSTNGHTGEDEAGVYL